MAKKLTGKVMREVSANLGGARRNAGRKPAPPRYVGRNLLVINRKWLTMHPNERFRTLDSIVREIEEHL